MQGSRAYEKHLRLRDRRLQFDAPREIIAVLEDLVELGQVAEDDVPVRVEHGEREEEEEVRGEVVGEEVLGERNRGERRGMIGRSAEERRRLGGEKGERGIEDAPPTASSRPRTRTRA